MPDQKFYVDNGRIFIVEPDGQGGYTIVREVTVYEAGRFIIEDFVQTGKWSNGKKTDEDTIAVGDVSSEAAFVQDVIDPFITTILIDFPISGTEEPVPGVVTHHDKFAQVLGSDSRTIRLVAKYKPRMAEYIWGIDVLQEATKNELPATEPVSQPANLIEGSDTTQGNAPPSTQPVEGAPIGPGGDTPTDTGTKGTANSPKKDSKTGGDPIILFSGQLVYQQTDLEVAGLGLRFSFTRTYLNQIRYRGPLGHNWDHSYNLWLREAREIQADGFAQNVVYRSSGAGRMDRYVQVVDQPIGELPPLTNTPDAVFLGPPGFFDRLERVGSRYVLQSPGGVRIEYGEHLYAERIVDRNGNAMTLEYEGYLLKTVRDTLGREYRLRYDELHRLIDLHDVVGDRHVRYFYSSNFDLEEVDLDFGEGFIAGTDYRYSGPNLPFDLQHNLTEIIGPTGDSLLETEYGTAPGTLEVNRVVRQRAADAEFRYEYALIHDLEGDPLQDPLNVAQSQTTVIHPNGHVVQHRFNGQGNVVQRAERILREGGGIETLVATYRYNEDGLLIEETGPDGDAREYRYGREAFVELRGDVSTATAADRMAFGNLTRLVERPRAGSGETRVLIREYAHEPMGQRLAHERGPYFANLQQQELPGQAVGELRYEYDDRGNRTRIVYPAVQDAEGQSLTPHPTELHYDARGRLIEERRGPIRKRYEYFNEPLKAGSVRTVIDDADGRAQRSVFEVDTLGRVTRSISATGAVTDIEWTVFDAPRRVTYPAVQTGGARPTLTLEYDRARRVVRSEETIILGNGQPHPDGALVRTVRYDRYGRIVRTTAGALGALETRVASISYTPSGQVRRSVDPLGTATTFRYDARLLPIATTRAAGTSLESTRRVRYNRSAEPIELVDALGHRTLLERNGFGIVQRVRTPDGSVAEVEHDAAGRPVRQQLSGVHPETGQFVRWAESTTRYDALGRVIESIHHVFRPGASGASPDARAVTRFRYDQLGRVVEHQDAGGGRWRYDYDNLGRVIRSVDPDGSVIRWQFDDDRNTVSEITLDVGRDEAGVVVQHVFQRAIQFDPRGLAEAEIDGLGNVTRRACDSRGLPTEEHLAGGARRVLALDVFGQLRESRLESANGHEVTTAHYDGAGNLTHLRGVLGSLVEYEHDALGRPIRERRGAGVREIEYDAEDRLVRQRDASGIVTSRTYTPGGLLASEAYDLTGFTPLATLPSYRPAPTPDRAYVYTPTGQLAAVRAGDAQVLLRYDSVGRVLEDQVGTRAVRSGYDLAGHQTDLIYPNGRAIRYEYSSAGHLTRVRQLARGSGYPGSLAAVQQRNLATVHRAGPHAVAVSFAAQIARVGYDPRQQPISVDWRPTSGTTALLRERALRGPDGEPLLQQLNGRTRLMTYDGELQLVRAEDADGLAPLATTTLGPARDEAALASLPPQAQVSSLVATSRAAITPGGLERSWSYALDAAGNRKATSTTTRGGPAQSTDYEPTPLDQYTSIAGNPTVYDTAGNVLTDGQRTFQYDAIHQLVGVSGPEGTLSLERDALGRLARLTGPEGTREIVYDGLIPIEFRSGATIESQVVPFGTGSRLAHVAALGQELTPMCDTQGSLIGLMSPSGVMVGETRYDPFGQVVERRGQWPVPFGFAGYLQEPRSGIYPMLARAYDPRLGRFLQRDPLGSADGPNVYLFARNAPGLYFDDWGYSAESNDLKLGVVAKKAGKTLGTAAAIAGAVTLFVAVFPGTAPFMLIGGLLLLAKGVVNNYDRREQEVIEAQKEIPGWQIGLAALGDAVGLSQLYESLYLGGQDALTDRRFSGDERSERLGEGAGSLLSFWVGPKVARAVWTLKQPPPMTGETATLTLATTPKTQGLPDGHSSLGITMPGESVPSWFDLWNIRADGKPYGFVNQRPFIGLPPRVFSVPTKSSFVSIQVSKARAEAAVQAFEKLSKTAKVYNKFFWSCTSTLMTAQKAAFIHVPWWARTPKLLEAWSTGTGWKQTGAPPGTTPPPPAGVE